MYTSAKKYRKRAIAQPFSHTSFHLPERAGHSPDKAPLALHIGFQISRVLPVSRPNCFLILRQNTVPAKVRYQLNCTIKFTCFSPDGTKRLFSGSGKQKRVIEQPFSLFIIYSFSFYRFTLGTEVRTLANIEMPLKAHGNNVILKPM